MRAVIATLCSRELQQFIVHWVKKPFHLPVLTLLLGLHMILLDYSCPHVWRHDCVDSNSSRSCVGDRGLPGLRRDCLLVWLLSPLGFQNSQRFSKEPFTLTLLHRPWQQEPESRLVTTQPIFVGDLISIPPYALTWGWWQPFSYAKLNWLGSYPLLFFKFDQQIHR